MPWQKTTLKRTHDERQTGKQSLEAEKVVTYSYRARPVTDPACGGFVVFDGLASDRTDRSASFRFAKSLESGRQKQPSSVSRKEHARFRLETGLHQVKPKKRVCAYFDFFSVLVPSLLVTTTVLCPYFAFVKAELVTPDAASVS